ncbi:mannose-binding protein C-like [Sycon ciliatum]|uniref:mannose-binding protein C-like n=1 Tax=Sycon ciliatum TaxID=27933 RepID=UPI0031F5FC52
MIRLTLACVLCLVCMTLAAEITSKKKSKRFAELFLDSLDKDEIDQARQQAEARRAAIGHTIAKKVNSTLNAMQRREPRTDQMTLECCRSQESGLLIYRYEIRRLTQQAARVNCLRNGGDLAAPRNMQEYLALAKLFLPFAEKGGVFLQYNDKRAEGTFVDSRGNAPWISNFEEGEPNDAGGDEDCVEMNGRTGEFNDVGCKEDRHSVCEFRIK